MQFMDFEPMLKSLGKSISPVRRRCHSEFSLLTVVSASPGASRNTYIEISVPPQGPPWIHLGVL